MTQFPRWLSWIVLIGLAYILYVGNTRDDVPPPRQEPQAVSETPKQDYKELQALLDRERWKRALNPDYAAAQEACKPVPVEAGRLESYAIVTREGEGEGAVCGETIEVTLTRVGNDGKANKPLSATLTLGEQKGLDALLVGMRPAEERLLIVTLPKQVKNLPANTLLVITAAR